MCICSSLFCLNSSKFSLFISLYSDTCAGHITVATSIPDDNACFSSFQEKLKKDVLSLKDAINDSENLTDFLMDFEEDE